MIIIMYVVFFLKRKCRSERTKNGARRRQLYFQDFGYQAVFFFFFAANVPILVEAKHLFVLTFAQIENPLAATTFFL
jgi:hypothetical protein